MPLRHEQTKKSQKPEEAPWKAALVRGHLESHGASKASLQEAREMAQKVGWSLRVKKVQNGQNRVKTEILASDGRVVLAFEVPEST